MGIQKLIQYVLIAVLGSTGAAALLTGDLTDQTVVIGLVVTVIGAIGTYLVPNTIEQPWAKQAAGIFTAAALVVVSAWTDQRFTPEEFVQILMAAVGAWQVGTIANSGARVSVK